MYGHGTNDSDRTIGLDVSLLLGGVFIMVVYSYTSNTIGLPYYQLYAVLCAHTYHYTRAVTILAGVVVCAITVVVNDMLEGHATMAGASMWIYINTYQ